MAGKRISSFQMIHKDPITGKTKSLQFRYPHTVKTFTYTTKTEDGYRNIIISYYRDGLKGYKKVTTITKDRSGRREETEMYLYEPKDPWTKIK